MRRKLQFVYTLQEAETYSEKTQFEETKRRVIELVIKQYMSTNRRISL